MRLKGLTAALVLIIAVGNVFGQWNQYSVGLADIDRIRVAANNETLFLLQKYSHLWMSIDQGENWDRVRDVFLRSDVVPEEFQIIENDTYLLYGKFQNADRFFLTYDRGETWSPLDLESSFASYALDGHGKDLFIDPQNDNRWIYTEADGIAVTLDRGESFVTHYDPLNWHATVKIWLDPNNSDHIYLLGQRDWGENNLIPMNFVR